MSCSVPTLYPSSQEKPLAFSREHICLHNKNLFRNVAKVRAIELLTNDIWIYQLPAKLNDNNTVFEVRRIHRTHWTS
ncbi:hypothetical protein AVEN_10850-1 [Araneus ventricosus]|uniref:Uncharacterized protein n=1 Tax=Araneus ventricosus TaxID=182803 RepID=A0A4Y2SGQ4_ARAVE|nr:hypothetical protein AVEN_10850-1 [Araneus ventricosus]